MLDISLVFKIAGVGIVLLIIDKILENNGKKDISTLVNLVGLIIILGAVVTLVYNLFDTVKTMFML
ncbi:MAG: stage III sporulation protein AC [Clostridium perfringens]|nr:stage III sporulation protein AC [Clostridium perfringens]